MKTANELIKPIMFSNHLKTTIFLASLAGLLVLGGYLIGGQSGAAIAFIISLVINFGSYWFSDKIVLKMYGATEILPNQSPDLHHTIESLAQQAGIPKPKLYLVDMPTPNAFATGRNPSHSAVAVSRGILDLLDKRELKGVLAHELAHIKNRDTLISTMAATIASAISYLTQMLYFSGAFFGGRDNRNNPLGLVGMLLFVILSPIVASLLHLAISRSREFIADETGARFTRDPEGLAKALTKLHNHHSHHPLKFQPKHEATAHLFISNPFKNTQIANLFSTHPPMRERVKRLKSLSSH